MKRTFIAAALMALAMLETIAATSPIYINNSPLISPSPATPTPPVINARVWWNRALFDVTPLTGLPYESQNTLFFTNGAAPAGAMVFDPGVRFFQNTNGQRLWMDTWDNRGSIATDHATFVTGLFVSDSRASILQVAATNIISTGPLSSGAQGIIRLEGRNIDLARGSLRTGTGPLTDLVGLGGFVGFSNYVNDVGVFDLYWGTGNGDALDNSLSTAMRLDGLAFRPRFSLPSPASTFHQIVSPSTFGFLFTNSTSLPGGSFFSGTNSFGSTNFSGYTAAVFTNLTSPTSSVIQVVFYPSNGTDTSFSTDVRFFDPSGGFFFASPAIAVVGFHSVDFDIATQTSTTNSVYLTDISATTTNFFLARNLTAGTRRPSTLEVSRSVPFEYFNGVAGNTVFSSNLFNNPNYTLTSATNRYAAYAAQVEQLSASQSGSIPYTISNVPGRIEIIGDRVNLDRTRIRAESALTIKANNLVSNNLAEVDAPLISYDVRSTLPSLVISNLAPPSVRRFGGSIRAWSAVWQNFESVLVGTNASTNRILFHVLIVDGSLQSRSAVVVNDFAARGTNISIADQINIGKSFVVEGNSLHVSGGLSLPLGVNLDAASLVNVRNFTNDGIINAVGSELLGTDRVLSYSNYVNRGTNIAAAHQIRTRNFENSGVIVANGGTFSVDALTASLVGNPLIQSNFVQTNVFFFFGGITVTNVTTNTITLQAAPVVNGVSDVQFYARDMVISNSIINAGNLLLNVTNRLADSGLGATNFWNVSAGFRAARRPATSDLLGTYVRSTTLRLGQSDHSWAGADLGNSVAGFTNNLALGKLTLDGADGSLFRFLAVGTSNALYVDYIELLNKATNFNSIFSIAPNFTIFFANANVPVSKLDGAAGGRFRWVSSFAGPLSSTNITYTSGSNYVFNIALVTSKDLDSDGDGIVNADDPEPVYVAESAVLFVSLASAPVPQVLLNWNALAYSSNYLEFKASVGESNWQVLTNFHMGPQTWPVQVRDPIPTNGATRVYRLRVDPGPF